MSKFADSMSKCKTFEEWESRYLRIPATDAHRADFDAVHGTAPKPKARRKRRTKAEMEASRG